MGKKIAMISALGGQGCTVAAAYIGSAAAENGRNVAMLDLCGFGGTLAHVLGVAEEVIMNVHDVIRAICTLEEAFVNCGEHLKVIPSCAFSSEQVSPYSVECRRVVESLAREGDVIADMPAGAVPDCGAVQCFDMFVICAHADRLSLQYAAALCRLIKNSAEECSCVCDVRLLLTEFSPDYMSSGGVTDIDECINTVGARLLGVVPYDKSAARAAILGLPVDTEGSVMRYCRDAVRRIYGEKVPLESKISLVRKPLFS